MQSLLWLLYFLLETNVAFICLISYCVNIDLICVHSRYRWSNIWLFIFRIVFDIACLSNLYVMTLCSGWTIFRFTRTPKLFTLFRWLVSSIKLISLWCILDIYLWSTTSHHNLINLCCYRIKVKHYFTQTVYSWLIWTRCINKLLFYNYFWLLFFHLTVFIITLSITLLVFIRFIISTSSTIISVTILYLITIFVFWLTTTMLLRSTSTLITLFTLAMIWVTTIIRFIIIGWFFTFIYQVKFKRTYLRLTTY